MKARLVIEPTMACFLSIRAGLRDAREERPPFFRALLSEPSRRREMLGRGWKDIGKVFVLAAILDVIYQWVVIRWVYPGETVILATALAILPYLFFRDTTTRIRRSWMRGSSSSRQP